MPDPANATLAEAIDHLRRQFAWLVDDFVRGRLVVWTGARFSEQRLPPLDQLLTELLDGIHARIDHSIPKCPYRDWLAEKVPANLHGPIRDVPSTWPHIQKIVDDFWLSYSALLDDDIGDAGVPVSLKWHILKIHEKYAPENPDPDAEHRFLALLMAERAVEESVTTNWDDLVETAFARTKGARVGRQLSVIVHRDDLAEPAPFPSLFKVHGCARRVRDDFNKNAEYVVATHTQITEWVVQPSREAVQERLRDVIRRRSIILVGSSLQDQNLQQNFAKAIQQVGPLPRHPPKLAFTSTTLEVPHRQVLKVLYGNEIFTAHRPDFERSSVLSLYSKPLLGSLYVLTLIRKAEAIADVASGELGSWTGDLRRGIELFERRLCEWFDNLSHGSPDEKWRELSRFLPALVSRFRNLREHAEVPGSDEEYHEFWNENVGEILQGSHPLGTKLHRVLLTLSVLMLGDEARHWVTSVAQSAEVTAGQFHIQAGSRSLAVFCLDNDSESWGRATQQGLIDEAVQTDVAVIYPSGSEPKDRPRYGTPAAGHSLPTRTRPLGPTQIWMDDERENAGDLNTLLASLQTQLKA